MSRTELLCRSLLVVYVLLLLWVVLFKFSLDLSAIFAYPERSLNLIPFADTSQTKLIDFTSNLRERVYNVLIFVPFGLLLSMNFKQLRLRHKLVIIFGFSLIMEVIQYALGIGIADVTDVITNTLGGLIGLVVYEWSSQYVEEHHLDRSMVVIGMVVLMVSILLISLLLLRDVQYGQTPVKGPESSMPVVQRVD